MTLPAEVRRLIAKWHLSVEADAVATPVGWVIFVRTGDGRAAVLKVHGPQSDEHASAAVLAHYRGDGAVALLAADPAGILIERAVPGTTLDRLVIDGEDDRATVIVADTIARLHRNRGLVEGLKTVENLGQGFVRHRRRGGDPRLADDLVDRAEALYAALCRTQAAPVVLHGDLHHYNILEDGRRGWVAIDPKGVIGEPAYETGAMLRNPIADPSLFADPDILRRRIRLLAERLGFDRDRITAWCFAQLVLAIIWAIEDGTDPTFGIRALDATLSLL